MSPSFDQPAPSPGKCPDSIPVHQESAVALVWTGYQTIILDHVDEEDPEINVKPYLERSPDFHKLIERLDKLRSRYPKKEEISIYRRLNAGYSFETVKKDVARFEQRLRRLIVLKDAISFDSPHLQEVKQHIENAVFYRANELLDIRKLTEEQTLLLAAKEDNNMDPGELDTRLRHNATCFFVKALLFELDRTNRRSIASEELFKRSITSYTFPENLFECCVRYQRQHYRKEIEPLYLQILDSYQPDMNQYAALALHNLAVMYGCWSIYEGDAQKAEEKLLEALAFYRNAERKNPGSFTPHVVAVLANLATVTVGKQAYPDKESYEKAEELFAECIDQLRVCAETNPRRYLPVFGKSLMRYARLLRDGGDPGSAARYVDEAVSIYTTLRLADRDRYQLLLFEALSASVSLSIEAGVGPDALEDCLEAMAICRELVQDNPGTYLPHLAETLRRLAIIHADMGLSDQAETEFRETISLYRYLRKNTCEVGSTTDGLARALNDIGVLYMNTNRPDLAKRELSRSIALYRTLMYNAFAFFNICRVMLNLSVLYQKIVLDKEKSSELASKVVYTVRPMLRTHEVFRSFSREAEEILHYWKVPESQWDGIIRDSKYVEQLDDESPQCILCGFPSVYSAFFWGSRSLGWDPTRPSNSP